MKKIYKMPEIKDRQQFLAQSDSKIKKIVISFLAAIVALFAIYILLMIFLPFQIKIIYIYPKTKRSL
jgi:uncharacterized membrane protein